MTQPRRYFQLSLKSLFLLTLLVATFFAGYVLRGKQDEAERRAADELHLKTERELQEVRAQFESVQQALSGVFPGLVDR
jgi:hypothetical protein